MNIYEYVQFEICQFRSPRVEYPWWGSTLRLSVSLFGTIRNPIGQQREQLLPVRERLGFFEPFCSPNWKGSVAKSLQKMGHWNSCGTILLLHNMNILPLLLGKSWYRECIHCISFHIAAHIISHRIWNPEGEWCSTSGAGTGWNQSWGNFQVSWAEIVVFVQCKSRWRTKSWESYYWLIGKFLYLRWFLTLANSFFIGKRVDFFRNDSLRKLEGLSLSFFNLFSTIRIPISDGQHHNRVWSDCNMTTIWFRPMLLYCVEKKPPGRFDAGKRTACVVVCVTGIVEPKEWSNSMAKNGPQNVCCARAQLGQNNWQERCRSPFKMSCDRNFVVVATDVVVVVCCLLFVCCPLLVASCLLVASFFFFFVVVVVVQWHPLSTSFKGEGLSSGLDSYQSYSLNRSWTCRTSFPFLAIRGRTFAVGPVSR